MDHKRFSKIVTSAKQFEGAAHSVFSMYEGSKSRVISLHETKQTLAALSVAQEKLFTEALNCTRESYFRAAHVLAWAAFMDFLEEKLASDGLVKFHTARPKYAKHLALEELRDIVKDYEFVTISKELLLITKAKMKTIHGLLSQRNECAHPGSSEPTMNETLGYISKLLRYIKEIQPKTL